MNPTTPVQPGTASRCEYLGLEHDAVTSLAYPSAWNICHRAMPRAAVDLAHQTRYCLTARYGQCPVFRGSGTEPLPPDYQAEVPGDTTLRRRKLLVPGGIAVLVLAIGLLLSLGGPAPTIMAGPQPSASVPAAAPLHGPGELGNSVDPQAAWLTEIASSATASASRTPGVPRNSEPNDAPTPAASPTPHASSFCGHRLDEPFGIGRTFIIHQVEVGESLDAYAGAYQTSVDAIEAVNARPVAALQPGRIIVIPAHQKNVDEVPPFEAFEISERNTTVGKVAEKLRSTNLNEFLLYNGINTTCPIFSGWVLAPREDHLP